MKQPRTDFRCREHPLADRVVRARLRGAAFEGVRTAMVDLLPGFRGWRATIQNVNRAVIEAVLHLQDAEAFVDSSKDPVRAKYLLETGDYDLHLIQLVRDGRAVTHSAMKHEQVSPEHAAREWRSTHEQIDRLAETLGRDRVARVCYEDLCSNPQDTMQSIWDFLSLTPCDVTGDFRRVENHILGNRMRLKSDSQIVLDEKWRSELSAADADAFDRVAGNLNRVFSYT